MAQQLEITRTPMAGTLLVYLRQKVVTQLPEH